MIYMLCMNRLKDYTVWRRIFDSYKQAHIEAGFHLKNIWCSSDDQNEVYFIFALDDKSKAEEFMNSPENARIGAEAGVIDGWVKYIDALPLY
jgi:hypothetical protein